MDMFENIGGYNSPSAEPVIVTTDGSVITENDIVTPFQVMKSLSEKIGSVINDPNPSCKSCYGRGYIGRDSSSKAPIPCRCILPKNDISDGERELLNMKTMSRAQKREYDRMMKKYMSKQSKAIKGLK